MNIVSFLAIPSKTMEYISGYLDHFLCPLSIIDFFIEVSYDLVK